MDEEIEATIRYAKEILERRAIQCGLVPDRIAHFEHEGEIFIICNPVTGTMTLHDGSTVEVRNVSYWVTYEQNTEDNISCQMVIKAGLNPIRAPFLLMKIDKDGNVIDGDFQGHYFQQELTEKLLQEELTTANKILEMSFGNINESKQEFKGLEILMKNKRAKQ